MSAHVAIVGGGLAGLACGKRLIDSGHQVTILERQPYLGGRASTFVDEDGDWIEQGLHLFMGVYSELRALLEEIGRPVEDTIHFTPQLRLQEPDGPEALFSINPLRAPLKTVTSLALQNRYLGPLDKLSAALVAAPGLLPFAQLQERFDEMTVVDWWRKASRDEELLERFLRPFCRGVQFTEPEEFSAFNFLGWIHHFSRSPTEALLGAYKGPRDETMFAPWGRWLTRRGAIIRTGVRLEEILLRGQGRRLEVAGLVLDDGSVLEADAYVMALPVWCLRRLLPEELARMPFFLDLESLPIAPALSVQIFFDGHVVASPLYTLVARSAACVYQDLSHNHFPDPRGSRVSVIVSPAERFLDEDDETIVRMVLDSLGRAERPLAKAVVRKQVVLRHHEHLVRPLPGAMPRRPTQSTPVPNLFLAGDWTRQPFFGSQEGAVRGGTAAAREVLRSLRPSRFEGAEAR